MRAHTRDACYLFICKGQREIFLTNKRRFHILGRAGERLLANREASLQQAVHRLVAYQLHVLHTLLK